MNVKLFLTAVMLTLSTTVSFSVYSEDTSTDTMAKGKIKSIVNMRSGQSYSSKKLLKLKANTQVDVLREEGNYDYISHNGKTGWVTKRFVEKEIAVVPTLVEEAYTPLVEAVADKKSFIDNAQEVSRNQFESFFQTLTKPWITFTVTSRDEDCLAHNIYYEAGGEPEEGKAAVGIVTVNRVLNGNFGKTICQVVNQRTMFVRSTVVPTTEYVQTGMFGGTRPVVKNQTVITHVPICQFAWVCAFVQIPKISNPAWEESQRVARALLDNGYADYREKYAGALYFHSTGIKPVWTQNKSPIARIGGHVFYGDI